MTNNVTAPQELVSYLERGTRIYFIGLGGISMCGLAEYCLSRGILVAGADANPNQRTEYLSEIGARVFAGHAGSNIEEFAPDLVVYSAAIPPENPELSAATRRNIPTAERAVFLGAITRIFPHVVNISGTNGKTTTTAMVSVILMQSGVDPTVHLGAELIEFKTTVHVGSPNILVSEACEFKSGFFNYRSSTVAVLNVIHDHIDSFPTEDNMIRAFAEFIVRQPANTNLVLPAFDSNVTCMLREIEKLRPQGLSDLNLFWFGAKNQSVPFPGEEVSTMGKYPQYTWSNVELQDGLPSFDVEKNGEFYTHIQLRIPGTYNIENALAAIAVSDLNGGTPEAATQALAGFRGAEGRFTYHGKYNGAKVYTDYAHHPSAITAAINAAKNMPHKRLRVCFQPILHSRVRGFFRGFVEALQNLEPVMLSEIYDTREKDNSISSRDICESIRRNGGKAEFYPDNALLEEHLRKIIEPGDLVLIMGGNVRLIADHLTGRKGPMDIVE